MKRVMFLIITMASLLVSCTRQYDNDLRIVFSLYSTISTANLFIIYKDGSEPVQLTYGSGIDSYCSWSPDGERIVFSSNRDGNNDIYIVNWDGKNLVQLTNNSFGNYMPTWSPDGTRILFYSNLSGNFEIYIMNADGTGLTNLTNYPSDNDMAPSMSPDGTQIVFVSTRIGGDQEIFVMPSYGSTTPTRLTIHPGIDAGPTWSSDGSKILYESFNTTYDLWLMNPDGTSPMNITNTPALSETSGSWSPDGTEIIFRESTTKQIGIMNMDGTGYAFITAFASYGQYYPCFEGKPR